MIFGHIFCKDHIDIHQQIYGILDLSLQGSKLGKTARSQLAPRYFFLGANIDN